MLHHSICPLCSGPDISLLHSCTDHLVSGKVFEIWRCGRCGFIITQDAPAAEDSARFYDSPDYISHSDSSLTFLDRLYQVVRKIMLNRKRKLVQKVCRINRGELLDIGSGTGHFMNCMKRAGWSVTGIEINNQAREYSTQHFSLNVFPPESISTFSPGQFDCITLWHVLEHLYNPESYFSGIRRILKPGGTVIVALPNSDSFDAKYFGKLWAAWDVPRHLWHFNPKVFRQFASKAGFDVRSEYVLPFDVFYISVLSERATKRKGGMLKGMILGKFFWLKTLFMTKRASSVVYILKLVSDQ